MTPSSLHLPRPGLLLLAGLLVGLAACGGDYPPPETEQIPFTETIHGVEFEDPYRWLEDQDSPETRAFIVRQNEYAELVVGETPERAWARRRLSELIDTPAVGSPNKAGDFEVFTLRRAGEGKALLSLVSYLQPPVTWLLDLETGTREVFQESEAPFSGDGYVLKQVRYTSKDGTSAPMYIAHRDDFEPDGTTPALLNGYGGFNVSLTPRFNPLAALWLEAGGVYAVATLRGGSEYGEEWHQAGMLHNKQTVFDDFISAGEWLVAESYSDPDRLAIHGASNGGLLVGASLTQRPDLYRAVLCGFPELDLIRFYTFTETNNMPALLEYGDGEIPDQFESLRGFSPYQAIRDGVAYPAVMLTQGDLDTRVPPLQARKVAARLQAATSSGLPVIMRYHPYAGHAASRGLPLSERIEFVAAEATFLLTQTGLAAPDQ